MKSETFRKGNDRCAKLRNIMIDIDNALDNDNGKNFFLRNSVTSPMEFSILIQMVVTSAL